VILRDQAASKLGIKSPLFYPPSDRREVLRQYSTGGEKNSIDIHPAVALWMIVGRTSRLIGKARQRELNKYGISIDASVVLFTLSLLGDQAKPATVSKYLFLEPHSVSQLFSRMETNGLLSKSRDLERRNYVRVVLTATGREVFTKSSKHNSTKSIISVLSENERGELESLLIKLRNNTIKYMDLEKPNLPID
jgi:MarR family transcriptional regulator, organic hydroperoxide resistance regulator